MKSCDLRTSRFYLAQFLWRINQPSRSINKLFLLLLSSAPLCSNMLNHLLESYLNCSFSDVRKACSLRIHYTVYGNLSFHFSEWKSSLPVWNCWAGRYFYVLILRNQQIIFPEWASHFMFPLVIWEGLRLSKSLPALEMSLLLVLVVPTDPWWQTLVIFICMSLMILGNFSCACLSTVCPPGQMFIEVLQNAYFLIRVTLFFF